MRMRVSRRVRLALTTALGAAFAGLCSVVPAQAQGEGGDESSAQPADRIVVTATLREQSLQDVPIAVTAFQGEALERLGAVGYTDLSAVVPNFSFDSLTNAGFTIPALRGIGLTGSTESAISNNPATGVYVDGVYLNSAGANLFSVMDVERVEILRGPQGTLYGRNTIGGVINIISREPDEEFTARLTATKGNFDLTRVAASISGPIVEDRLFGRFGLTGIKRDGYVENAFSTPNPIAEESGDDADSLDSVAGRASLTFRPSERLEFNFAADYAQDRTTYPGYNVEDGASPDLSAYLGPAGAAYTDTDGDVHAISYNSKNKERAVNWGGALTGEWTSGNTRLVSITGYRESTYLDDLSDIDGTPVNLYQQYIRLDETSFSQELRYHYETERLNAVVGAFYYDYEGRQDIANDILGIERDLGYPLSGGVGPGLLGGGTTRTVVDIETTSYSLFGHASYALTDKLEAEAGLRWTNTSADFSRPVSRAELGVGSDVFYNGGVAFDETPSNVLLFDLGNTFGAQERTFSRVSPSLGLNYHPSDNVMLYATWSQGFREGGFASNPSNATGILSFGPETLTSYEVGAKASLFSDRLTVNTAAYHYDYTDQQVEVPTITNAGLLVDIFNSGESEARGLEVEFLAVPSDHFQVQGSLGWQDTEFKRLNAGVLGDLSGNAFPRAPEFSAALAPTLSFDVSGLGSLSLRPEWQHQSSEFMTVANDPLARAAGRNVFNVSGELQSENGAWSVSVWSKNVTDEEYLTKVVDLSSFLGYRLRRYGDPQTYGVTFNYTY